MHESDAAIDMLEALGYTASTGTVPAKEVAFGHEYTYNISGHAVAVRATVRYHHHTDGQVSVSIDTFGY